MLPDIVLQSRLDLREDLTQIKKLWTDQLFPLKKSQQPLWYQSQVNTFISNLNQLTKAIDRTKSPTDKEIESWIELKNQLKIELRKLFRLRGALICQDEWQSPPFFPATSSSNDGSFSGPIYHTQNDYKRDRHHMATMYENAFNHLFPSSLLSPGIASLATVSGMAAFITILDFLRSQNIHHALMESHSYFELKLAAPHHFSSYQEFDSSNLAWLHQQLARNPASAVFVDTLSNDGLQFQPLITAIARLIKNYPDSWLIVDNTFGSINLDVIALTHLLKHRIIFFESLNKYHQYGMDAVTAGIIYATAKTRSQLFTRRMHAGTNIPDASVALLPKPNRDLLKKRLERIQRNANLLHTLVSKALPPTNNQALQLFQAQTHKSAIFSPYLTITNGRNNLSIRTQTKICQTTYRRAKRADVPLIGGTSFGFDYTRLYLTAKTSKPSRPFIRLSPGNETVWEIHRLAKVITKALNSL